MAETSSSALVALGILTGPASIGRRNSARTTWMRDPAIFNGDIIARFVFGELSSCRTAPLDAALADVVIVAAPDCAKWHAAAKVHAWYKLALVRFPSALWIGKTEDDAMPWPAALVSDLRMLSDTVQYFGVLAWQGSCPSQPSFEASTVCAGCYGGRLADGSSMCRAALCRPSGFPDGRTCCQVGCPRQLRMAPFALGALDVRRRELAASVARCRYADRYFERVSALGDATGSMCVSADGAQGHAFGECLNGMIMADAGGGRLVDANACKRRSGRCAAGSAALVHPLKSNDPIAWNRTWTSLIASRVYTPQLLVEARVTSMGPKVRPSAARVPALVMERVANGESAELVRRWTARTQYLETVIARQQQRRPGFSSTAAVGGGGSSLSTIRQAQPNAVRPMRGARRRLKSEPIWSTNCSRFWGG